MGECPYEQGGYFIIDGKENNSIMREKQRRRFMSEYKWWLL